jgi:hypothetical protein
MKNLLFSYKSCEKQVPTKLKSEPEPGLERKLLKSRAGAGAETNSFGSTTQHASSAIMCNAVSA